MRAEGISTHVVCEQVVWEIDSLFDQATRSCHDRGDDVDVLGDVGHPKPFGLADEDITPDSHGQHVRDCVQFFGALIAGGTDWIPDVPFVEADFWSRLALCLDSSLVDHGGDDLDGTFGRQWSTGVWKVSGFKL